MTETVSPAQAAEALVQRYCGWHIGLPRTETFTVDGSGGSLQMLPTLYLTDVVSVTSDAVLLDPLTYDWSKNGYLERIDGYRWSCRLRGITATITHGYDTYPEEVDALLDRLSQRITDDAGTLAQVGEVRYSISGSIASAGLLTKADKVTLAPFRIPR